MYELGSGDQADPETKTDATLRGDYGGLPTDRSAVAHELLDQHRMQAGSIQRWLSVLMPTTSQ